MLSNLTYPYLATLYSAEELRYASSKYAILGFLKEFTEERPLDGELKYTFESKK